VALLRRLAALPSAAGAVLGRSSEEAARAVAAAATAAEEMVAREVEGGATGSDPRNEDNHVAVRKRRRPLLTAGSSSSARLRSGSFSRRSRTSSGRQRPGTSDSGQRESGVADAAGSEPSDVTSEGPSTPPKARTRPPRRSVRPSKRSRSVAGGAHAAGHPPPPPPASSGLDSSQEPATNAYSMLAALSEQADAAAALALVSLPFEGAHPPAPAPPPPLPSLPASLTATPLPEPLPPPQVQASSAMAVSAPEAKIEGARSGHQAAALATPTKIEFQSIVPPSVVGGELRNKRSRDAQADEVGSQGGGGSGAAVKRSENAVASGKEVSAQASNAVPSSNEAEATARAVVATPTLAEVSRGTLPEVLPSSLAQGASVATTSHADSGPPVAPVGVGGTGRASPGGTSADASMDNKVGTRGGGVRSADATVAQTVEKHSDGENGDIHTRSVGGTGRTSGDASTGTRLLRSGSRARVADTRRTRIRKPSRSSRHRPRVPPASTIGGSAPASAGTRSRTAAAAAAAAEVTTAAAATTSAVSSNQDGKAKGEVAAEKSAATEMSTGATAGAAAPSKAPRSHKRRARDVSFGTRRSSRRRDGRSSDGRRERKRAAARAAAPEPTPHAPDTEDASVSRPQAAGGEGTGASGDSARADGHFAVHPRRRSLRSSRHAPNIADKPADPPTPARSRKRGRLDEGGSDCVDEDETGAIEGPPASTLPACSAGTSISSVDSAPPPARAAAPAASPTAPAALSAAFTSLPFNPPSCTAASARTSPSSPSGSGGLMPVTPLLPPASATAGHNAGTPVSGRTRVRFSILRDGSPAVPSSISLQPPPTSA